MAGKKLLVADDSLTIQKVIRLALSNEGYEIQAVSDGNDAVQQISLFRPDVILIDVSLPGRSAFEVKRAINEHEDLSDVRFVLMSSAFEKVDEEQAGEVVFHGRLTKPFDPGHLREVLNGVLDQISSRTTEATISLDRPPPSLTPPLAPPSLPSPPQWKTGNTYDKYPSAPKIATELPGPEQTMEIITEITPPTPRAAPPSQAPKAPPSQASKAPPPQAPKAPPPIPVAAATPPPASLPPSSPPRGEDDIRQLTESTIKMSGLDDYEWSVQEPSLKPPPSLLDSGEVGFTLDPTSSPDPYAFSLNENLSAPPPQLPPQYPPPPASSVEISPGEPHFSQAPLSQPSLSPPAQFPASVETTMPSRELIEELVRKQVEEILEKMAQTILPQVAEKLIKAEIHRMLNEQF